MVVHSTGSALLFWAVRVLSLEKLANSIRGKIPKRILLDCGTWPRVSSEYARRTEFRLLLEPCDNVAAMLRSLAISRDSKVAFCTDAMPMEIRVFFSVYLRFSTILQKRCPLRAQAFAWSIEAKTLELGNNATLDERIRTCPAKQFY